MQSIAEIGYSDAEPLLVVEDSSKKKYIVVEGNRRLTALKLLIDPGLAKVRKQQVLDIASSAKKKTKNIPCILYDHREDILNYLGYRHITGIKEWGSLEKAKYLKDLFDVNLKEGEDIYKTLAKMIGSRSDYVERLLTSYELYCFANDEAYFGSDISEEDIVFSYFTTALGYKAIRKYLNIEFDRSHNHLGKLIVENYKMLFQWLFDPKKHVIMEGRQISTLSNIIESQESIDKLKSTGSLEQARLYTSEPQELFVSQLKSAYNSLTSAKASIEQLSGVPEHFDEMLIDIEKTIRSIRGGVEENFSNEENNVSVSLSLEEYQKIKALMEKAKL